MPVNEFIIVIGMIIVGLIFFLIAQNFIFGGLASTKENMYKAEAEGIVSLIQRTMSEQGNYFYYFREISLSNVSVKNGILTYQKNNLKFLYPIPKEVSKTDLTDVASVCVLKKNGNVELLERCPKCNMDSMCSYDECKENCQDCYGPNSLCIGDGFCNNAIGENCENSVADCPCKTGVCCPSSSDSDNHGCSNILNIPKGKECGCSSQCESGLDCNPTAPTFIDYRKACCVPGKGWDGTDCVEIKCPDEKMKCPGAPMTGGNGDNAWTDINGDVCCPLSNPLSNIGDISGPVCSNKHCCPTDKPKWCNKPISGEPRCMSEQDYKDKSICKSCKKTYILVVVANNYADMSAFRARVNKEMQIVRDESPFRECPDCLDIKILDVNCQADPMSAGSIISCVHSNYGRNYNLIYAASASAWCNGYSMVGTPFTICSSDLPPEIRDVCAIHEIGHNAGALCDEYGYSYWVGEGCPASGWSPYNLKKSSQCKDIGCGSGDGGCCGTKLKPDDPSDKTVDIMGGGGGMIGCSGSYVLPSHFRDYNYNRFKSQISEYCE
jgi:hypothetical protein